MDIAVAAELIPYMMMRPIFQSGSVAVFNEYHALSHGNGLWWELKRLIRSFGMLRHRQVMASIKSITTSSTPIHKLDRIVLSRIVGVHIPAA